MTDNLESVVTPHQLCPICQKIVASYTPDDSWKRESFFLKETWDVETGWTLKFPGEYEEYPDICLYWLSRKPLKHHSDFHCLKRLAEGGCHLCSLLVGLPRPIFRNAKAFHWMDCYRHEAAKQLYLAPVPPNFQRSESCCTIHVGLFADCWIESLLRTSRALPLTEISIHLHPKHEALDEGLIIPCTGISKGMDPKQPTESRLRWYTSTGSGAGSQMIARWLQYCTTHHKECNNIYGDSRPTRLLDLEMNAEEVRLVLENDVGPQPYATLSYSWGHVASVRLRHNNCQELFSGIRVETLPRTIREAIEVCRRLSIRYLWVDALCIMQEDDKDFADEISRMGSIYARSFITIAAADSSDCESGCFRDRSPLYQENCRIWEDERRLVFFSKWDLPKCDNIHLLEGHALDSRAWVHQERMMSPRTIHFCHNEIVWECRETIMCGRCDGAKPLATTNSRLKKIFIKLQRLRDHGSGGSYEFPSIWRDILNRYSKTILSNDNDRLSALAGIAEFPLQKLGYRASFGLWLPLFLDELVWAATKPSANEVEGYNTVSSFPSWSWVGIKGPVHNMSKEFFVATQILHFTAAIQLPSATPFGQISILYKEFPHSVSFKARGWLINCRQMVCLLRDSSFKWILRPTDVSATVLPYEELSWKAYSIRQSDPSDAKIKSVETWQRSSANVLNFIYNIQLFPDTKPESSRNLFCFLLKRVFCKGFDGRVLMKDFSLVLEQVDPERNRFRRVGICIEGVPCSEAGFTNLIHYLDEMNPGETKCRLRGRRDMYEVLSKYVTLFSGQKSLVEIEIV